MKKYLLTCLMVGCLLLTMVGCSAAGMERTLDRAEDRMEDRVDAVEDSVEDAVRRAVSPAPAAIPEAPVAPGPAAAPEVPAATPRETSAAPTAENRITVEQAQQIALDYVGLTADQVQRLHTQFEIDDGIPQYDVEFHEGNWEYEFEIHAETGNILSYDRDDRWD